MWRADCPTAAEGFVHRKVPDLEQVSRLPPGLPDLAAFGDEGAADGFREPSAETATRSRRRLTVLARGHDREHNGTV